MDISSARDAPVELPSHGGVVATMRGRAVREAGFWVVKGKWSLGWNQAVKSDFHYRATGFSPDSERPYCGRYEGWFSMLERGNRSRRFTEKSLEMSFTANSEGGYNVTGMSVTEFATSQIVGLVAPDKKVRLVKVASSQPRAPVAVAAAAAAAPQAPQAPQAPIARRAPPKKAKAGVGRKKPNDVWARCMKILVALSEDGDKAFWFNDPWEKVFPEDSFPDYRSRIQHPMDFPRIKAKLRQRKYRTLAEFAADVRLTFENAKAYYPMRSHPCNLHTVELSRIFEEKFAAIEAMPVPPPALPRQPAARKHSVPRVAVPPAAAPRPLVKAASPPKSAPTKLVVPRRAPQVHVAPQRPKTRPTKAAANSDWAKEAMQIIRFCLADPDADWFRHPVPSDLRGYTKIIKRPMDFSTLKSQLRAKKYATMDDFMADARLIFSNAMAFNRKGEPCYMAAEKIQRLMEQKYRDLTGVRAANPAGPPSATGAATVPAGRAVRAEDPGLTVEEKARLEEEVGLLEDADVEKILDMITESGQGADEDGEVDLDKLTVPLQRKLQAFVRKCLHPESVREEAKAAAPAAKTEADAEAMEVVEDEAKKGAADDADDGYTDADSHAMRGKTVDAPPVKVSVDQEKPDSAKTDGEHSPRDSPPPAPQEPEDPEVPRTSNLFHRVDSQIDGDRTSSSEDDSDDEQAMPQSASSSKRKLDEDHPVPVAKKAKMEPGSTAASTQQAPLRAKEEQGEEAMDTEKASEGAVVQQNPSLSSWITSAAKFDEKAAPEVRPRADSLDQDSRLWEESQKKAEELKTIEKIRREEEEERKALLEKKRAEEEEVRLRAAEERRERLKLEEERLEKQKQQEIEERTRLAREGVKDAPKVNLDEDENLLEEFCN